MASRILDQERIKSLAHSMCSVNGAFKKEYCDHSTLGKQRGNLLDEGSWIIGAEPLLGSRFTFCRREMVFRMGNRKSNPSTYCCFSSPSMAPSGLAQGSQER